MTERPYDPIPIGKVLDDHSERLGMGGARHVGTLFASWERIVGPEVAAHVEPTSLRDGTLKLRADSPTWATEIGYLRGEIRAQANAALGAEVIQRVEVGAGPRRGPAPKISSHAGAPSEPSEGTAEPGTGDDPLVAFQRARAAWLRRSGRRR